MMREKKKGFTIIELLATIIIIGLLVSIAYISVTSILDNGDNNYYKSQEDMLVLAGREYYADNRSELPDDIGDTSTVPLEKLVEEKYIDPITDEDGNDCNGTTSGVTVQKVTEKDYQYYGLLVCDNYTTTEDKSSPKITFSPNKKSSEGSITVKMNIEDNQEVESYKYVITKDGEEYRDSGYQLYNGDITIKLTELGVYKITGYAIDTSGNRATRESGKYSVYKGIDCGQVDIINSLGDVTSTNKDITLSFKLPSNTYRVELSQKTNDGEYEIINSTLGNILPDITFNTEGKYQIKAEIYNQNGNSCSAVSDEYIIDRTNPSLSVLSKKKTSIEDLDEDADISDLEDYQNDSWYSGYVALKGMCTDEGSGCSVSYKVTGASINTDGFVDKSLRNINAEGTSTIEYRATDAAGNTSTETYTVKLDRTAPSLSVALKKKANSTDLGNSSNINSLKNYTNDTWYSGYVVLRGSCSDNTGDCTVSYKVTGASTNTADFVNGTTRNINAQGTSTVHYKATDTAGNTTTKSFTIKLDRTKPTVSYNIGGGIYPNSSLKICATAQDNETIKSIEMQPWKNGKRITLLTERDNQVCYTLSGYGKYTIYTKVWDGASNIQSTTPQNKNKYYYQNYTLQQPTKKLYLCRNGKTFINWRKTTSCANTEENRYNCMVTIYSNINNPTSVEVKSQLDGDFYVMVNPLVRTTPGGETFTYKYIYKTCLVSTNKPTDCASTCRDH